MIWSVCYRYSNRFPESALVAVAALCSLVDIAVDTGVDTGVGGCAVFSAACL